LPEEKWSLFGNRTEQIEKQLILNKKASLAHQMHNSFLSAEITRLEKEMHLQIKMREQTVDRLKKEVTLLRRRLLNLSRDKIRTSSISLDKPDQPDNTNENIYQDYELLKKRFFMSHALGVKLNLSFVQGKTCNVPYDELYDLALKEGVTDWELWPEWLENYMDANAK